MGIEEIVRDILDIEVKMFLEVMVPVEPECRSQIDDLRLHRCSQFAGWSVETLRSYLNDLRSAEKDGCNLMTLKYARMEDRIPRLTRDPRITEILDIYVEWQRKFIAEYPGVMNGGRDIDDFRNYLRSELETYSTSTLKQLKGDVEKYLDSGRSMVLEIYERMAVLAGYDSLAEMESAFSD